MTGRYTGLSGLTSGYPLGVLAATTFPLATTVGIAALSIGVGTAVYYGLEDEGLLDAFTSSV